MNEEVSGSGEVVLLELEAEAVKNKSTRVMGFSPYRRRILGLMNYY